MCIEPQDEERATERRRVARHAGNAAHGQTVVAAQDDRHVADGCGIECRLLQCPRHGGHDGEIVCSRMVGQVGGRCRAEVAAIGHVMSET
ncbi:hypothetical protein D3C87_1733890 [compost metagenome]